MTEPSPASVPVSDGSESARIALFCITIGHEDVPAAAVGTFCQGDGGTFPDTPYCDECARGMDPGEYVAVRWLTSTTETPRPEPQAQQVGSPAGGGSELRAHNSPPAVPGRRLHEGWEPVEQYPPTFPECGACYGLMTVLSGDGVAPYGYCPACESYTTWALVSRTRGGH